MSKLEKQEIKIINQILNKFTRRIEKVRYVWQYKKVSIKSPYLELFFYTDPIILKARTF